MDYTKLGLTISFVIKLNECYHIVRRVCIFDITYNNNRNQIGILLLNLQGISATVYIFSACKEFILQVIIITVTNASCKTCLIKEIVISTVVSTVFIDINTFVRACNTEKKDF